MSRSKEKWTNAMRLHYTKRFTVIMQDGTTVAEGTLIAWTPVRAQFRFRFGIVEFYRSDGRVMGGDRGQSPHILPDELQRVNEYIRACEKKTNATKAAPQNRSAHVLVTHTDVGVAVEGGGHIVRFFTPVGYKTEDVAAELEAIFAWAEQRARTSALQQRQGRAAGQASVAARKVVRTKRRAGEP